MLSSMCVPKYPSLNSGFNNRNTSESDARAYDQVADFSESDGLFSVTIVDSLIRCKNTLIHKVTIPLFDDFDLEVRPEHSNRVCMSGALGLTIHCLMLMKSKDKLTIVWVTPNYFFSPK